MYFITICVQNQECLFGEIEDGKMKLNDAGHMVATVWDNLPNRFPFVAVDEFVAMPNHIHGIIVVTDREGESYPGRIAGDHKDRPYQVISDRDESCSDRRGESGIRPQKGDDRNINHRENRPYGTLAGTVGRVIQAFKSLTTHAYTIGVKQHGWMPFPGRLWQRNYPEHVIRSEDALNRIRDYILTNPLRWELDRENPARQGEDEFDRWLASLSLKEVWAEK
jgi:REP element-mobilizing transposase RayT